MALKALHVKYLCIVLYVSTCILLSAVNNKYPTTKQKLKSFKYDGSDESDMRILDSTENLVRNIQISNVESEFTEGSNTRNELTDLQDNLELLQQISKTCVKYKLKTPLVRTHYLRSPENRAIYCWIRKVASTSFTKFFSDMHNRSVTSNYYREVDILAPESHEELVALAKDQNVFKFLIVRNPFERLVSSYRNRLEDNTRYTAQAWIYAQRIFHVTRPELFHTNKTTGSTLSRIFGAHRRLKLIPSFNEFVTWLLQEPTSRDDVHWAQYNSHCSLCEISYSLVLKLENYTSTWMSNISTNLGVHDSQYFLPRLQQSEGGSSDFSKTCSYFRNLTQNTVLQLYQRYKIDFEMFAYDFKRYMNCAKADMKMFSLPNGGPYQ